MVFGEISLSSKVTNLFTSAGITVIDTTNSTIVLGHPISNSGGPFYWHLSPGQYAILEMIVHFSGFGQTETRHRRIYAEFSVDSPAQLIYIGNLQVDWAAKDKFITVEDDYENALEAIHANYPKLQGVPVKQLLELEEKL